MSTFVNMEIKQVIKNSGIPFEIKNPKLSKDLLEVLQEGEQIIKDLENGKRKGYLNVRQMFEDILNED